MVINEQFGTVRQIADYRKLGNDPHAAVAEGRNQGILPQHLPDDDPRIQELATHHFGCTAQTQLETRLYIVRKERSLRTEQ